MSAHQGNPRSIRLVALAAPGQRDWVAEVQTILERMGASPFALEEMVAPGPAGEKGDVRWREALLCERPDVLLVGPGTAHPDWGQEVLRAARSRSPELPVLVVAGENDAELVSAWLEAGARDFVTTPLRPPELLARLWRLRPAPAEPRALSRGLQEKLGLRSFVGESPAFVAALNRIPAVAQCDATVLITGETGTGKELCARAIHYLSARSGKPFVPVNCGAIPLELVENHLFGHEQGAYTGAHTASTGLFRTADGGTLLLDEIDTLPLAAQVKLLRFLQDRQFQPLGSSRTLTVNVRTIAACNSDLEAAVRAGRFRQDLYYRLSVVPIELPPLRQRREDIPSLARHFLAKYAAQYGKPATEFGRGALQKLAVHSWPGNVRELENVVERAVILARGRVLQGEDLDLHLAEPTISLVEPFKSLKAQAVAQFERNYLQQVLCAHHGNITQASRAARKDRRAFWQLLRKHNLVTARTRIS